MKLEKLTIRNFRSFGRTQTVNLNNMGLTLIVGDNKDNFQSNGAGKSSLLEAIIYALYGETSNKDKVSNLVNRHVGKNMEITLSFMEGKSKYLIKRYRKDSKFKNKTLLFQNGKEITQSSVSKTNKVIAGLIGISKDTYLHSYMFGLGHEASFAMMTDRQKKQVLDNMADLAIYPIARDISKNDADHINQKIEQVHNKIEAIKYSLKSLKSVQKSIYADNKNRHDRLVMLAGRVTALKKKTLKMADKHTYAWYQNSIKKIDKKSSKISARINNSDVNKLNNKIGNLSQVTDHDTEKLSQLKGQIKSVALLASQDKKRLVLLASKKQKRCYWCGNLLNTKQRKQEITKIALDYKKQVDSLSEIKNGITRQARAVKSDKGLHDKFVNKLPDFKPLTTCLARLSNAKSDYQQAMFSVKSNLHDLKSVALRFNDLKNEKPSNIDSSKISALQKKYNQYYQQLKVLKQGLKLYQGSESVYSNHGVKSMLLDLILPFVNKQTNHYLQILTGGKISVFIAPTSTSKSTGNTSEKINLKVSNAQGADNYKGLSSGEKKRVDLAILLAFQDYVLSKASTSMNVVAFDEVFDALDETGTDDVIRLINERAKQFPNILVVSHNSRLKELFTHYIVITKHKGMSVITSK